jgi:preprotein translocase subunit Sec63
MSLTFYVLLIVKFINGIIKKFKKDKKLILFFVMFLIVTFLVLLFFRSNEEKKTMTPWEVLSVPKNATQKEIRKQQRNLGREVHPDNPENQGDENKKNAYLLIQQSAEM